MLWISRILADLVKEYVASVSQSAGEYRLVVPGLTSQIGEELHTLLLANGIHSFLVIGTDRIPDERKRWLLPVSLTTMRIGSFVAVADPGALSNIQDSIRGVRGGAIRGAAFSRGVAVDRQWNRRVPICWAILIQASLFVVFGPQRALLARISDFACTAGMHAERPW